MLYHTETFIYLNVILYNNMANELLDIISDLNFWHNDQEIGLARKELEPVLKLVDMPGVSFFILGVRRAGKTFLAKQILKRKIDAGLEKNQTLYINFEDKKLEPYLNAEILDKIYDSYREELNPKGFVYLVLDEVQNVPGWEKWIRMLLEKKEDVKIIVTGSGSRILTPQLANILTGRRIQYSLFPLSFAQFCEFNRTGKKYQKQKDIFKLLRDYLKFGGLPLVALNKQEVQKTYFLQQVYDDIITKDISFRFKLREEQLLRKVSFLVMNSFSKYVSLRRIGDTLKSLLKENISPSTLSNYFEYFSQSFLFIFVPIFSYNIKDQEQYPKKVYCVDTGLINSILPKFSENIGRLYENVVLIELLRKNSLNKNIEFYYWKNPLQEEVDFVIKEGLKVKQLIQVCYSIDEQKTKKRELRALIKASQELKCRDLTVITDNYFNKEKVMGKTVKFIPLWKWLLTD